MITRNDLRLQHFGRYADEAGNIAAFKMMSDNQLAKYFNLKVLRRGYFVN